MEFGDFKCALFLIEEAVHERKGDEESLIVTAEIGHHLDHPIYHPGAQHRGDFVPLEAGLRRVFELDLSEVTINIITEVERNMHNFSLDFCGPLPPLLLVNRLVLHDSDDLLAIQNLLVLFL